jgi:pimeloyl-ACP methyl ester carboxylesterase
MRNPVHNKGMAHFVLIHGAWHGAWCWQRVLPLLRAAGHAADAVTLTGVGERAHLLTRNVTLETHIADVMNFIHAQELQDVVLVLHSYAGMVGTAVADRLQASSPGLLKHLVYVDAAIPNPGESWSSRHPDDVRQARTQAAITHPQGALPPPDPSVFGLSGADHAWVARRQTLHPFEPYTHALDFDMARVASVARTFIDCDTPPLKTIDSIRERVRDPQFWGGLWAQGGRTMVLHTGHDPMVSAPLEFSNMLLECAA